jgi:hypothetical protein
MCVVGDEDGAMLSSTNPLGGAAAWSGEVVVDPNGIDAVSCPVAGACVATDMDGGVIAGFTAEGITTSVPAATVGTPYSAMLTATGGFGPFTWSIVSGTLPSGLRLSPNGVLSGTPTAAVTAQVGVEVVDSSAPARTATTDLDLSVTS